MSRFIDLTNKRFGHWLVISFMPSMKRGQPSGYAVVIVGLSGLSLPAENRLQKKKEELRGID